MGDIKNCRKCGKSFFTNGLDDVFCKCCSEEEKRVYKELREYLYNNPGTSAYDLSIKFNIRIDRITRYIQDGRLSAV